MLYRLTTLLVGISTFQWAYALETQQSRVMNYCYEFPLLPREKNAPQKSERIHVEISPEGKELLIRQTSHFYKVVCPRGRTFCEQKLQSENRQEQRVATMVERNAGNYVLKPTKLLAISKGKFLFWRMVLIPEEDSSASQPPSFQPELSLPEIHYKALQFQTDTNAPSIEMKPCEKVVGWDLELIPRIPSNEDMMHRFPCFPK